MEWSGFANDYETEDVAPATIEAFKTDLRQYFDRHAMTADRDVLNKLPIEQVVNNLVLIMNMNIGDKQKLLGSPTVSARIELFSRILNNKAGPILASRPQSKLIN